MDIRQLLETTKQRLQGDADHLKQLLQVLVDRVEGHTKDVVTGLSAEAKAMIEADAKATIEAITGKFFEDLKAEFVAAMETAQKAQDNLIERFEELVTSHESLSEANNTLAIAHTELAARVEAIEKSLAPIPGREAGLANKALGKVGKVDEPTGGDAGAGAGAAQEQSQQVTVGTAAGAIEGAAAVQDKPADKQPDPA